MSVKRTLVAGARRDVAVACDGCAAGLTAHVATSRPTRVSRRPVIYSREERKRLTFLVEAVLDQVYGLLPDSR